MLDLNQLIFVSDVFKIIPDRFGLIYKSMKYFYLTHIYVMFQIDALRKQTSQQTQAEQQTGHLRVQVETRYVTFKNILFYI